MIQGIVSVLMIRGIISVFMIQGIITIPTTTRFFKTPSPQAPEGWRKASHNVLRFAKASRNVLHFAEVISEAHAKLGTFSTNWLGLEQSDRTSQEVFVMLREYRQSCNMTGEQNTTKQGPA